MKFIARFYADKWNGHRLSQGRQVKQFTFRAKDWDEAERIVDVFSANMYEKTGRSFQNSLTVIK